MSSAVPSRHGLIKHVPSLQLGKANSATKPPGPPSTLVSVKTSVILVETVNTRYKKPHKVLPKPLKYIHLMVRYIRCPLSPQLFVFVHAVKRGVRGGDQMQTPSLVEKWFDSKVKCLSRCRCVDYQSESTWEGRAEKYFRDEYTRRKPQWAWERGKSPLYDPGSELRLERET